MMDEVAFVILTILVVVFAGVGIFFTVEGTPTKAVIEACKTQGYWQTGQTRIICSVEEPKK